MSQHSSPGGEGEAPGAPAELEEQARQWAYTDDPAALSAQCPESPIEYLATGWGAGRSFAAFLANPAVPDTARVALAGALSGYRKKHLVWTLVEHRETPSAWVAMVRAITASALADGLRTLEDTGRGWRPYADDARRTALIEAFATSSDPRARALAAQCAR